MYNFFFFFTYYIKDNFINLKKLYLLNYFLAKNFEHIIKIKSITSKAIDQNFEKDKAKKMSTKKKN